jgi:hypothetical protein
MLYLLSQLRTLEFISARGWDKTLKIKQQLEEQWLKCLLFLFLLVIDTIQNLYRHHALILNQAYMILITSLLLYI